MLRRVWTVIHWLSLDVILGTALSGAMICRSWGVSSSLWHILGLGAATLFIYSADHLYDARRISQELSIEEMSARRIFHMRHQNILKALMMISVIIGGWVALHLSLTTLFLGAGVALFCLLYLWIAQRGSPLLIKEPLIALVYMIALSLWPWSQLIDQWGEGGGELEISVGWGLITSCEVALLAFTNLLIIAIYEHKSDLLEGERSITTRYGERFSRQMCKLSIIGCVCLSVCCLISLVSDDVLTSTTEHLKSSFTDTHLSFLTQGTHRGAQPLLLFIDQAVIICMNLTLYLLLNTQQWSAQSERYRRWGDLIFSYPIFTPVLLILLC